MPRYPDGEEVFAKHFVVEPVPATARFARDIAMGMGLDDQLCLVEILSDWQGRDADALAQKIGCSPEMAGALREVYGKS